MERSYRWIQDRIVRTCARKDISEIAGAQRVLRSEIYRYNFKQVHSTTGEVPYYRFREAIEKSQLI